MGYPGRGHSNIHWVPQEAVEFNPLGGERVDRGKKSRRKTTRSLEGGGSPAS